MKVAFVLTATGQELLQMVSHDVAGLLAAVKGEYVTFPFGTYKYDFHTLDFYLENNEYHQELVIYLKEEESSKESVETFFIDAE
ncbi:thymidylate synthase [Ureibacillus sp. FSL K6-8385]|uniref:Thymidylate synthase n=1 Tax=Ureibacillus terrenus TaxID=118246 RepID=A0A540V6D0_9BACL|nr:thymidylate synthase [Ureibacillus terrenus]MED3661583.1 thymidylate synthase [Ureibacillus terrenus]MED3763895.1 thymidylate synthase [Ureibacillus terrenus]TQE91733.1 thymidylate synthase [Ureibacillus terrenus]